MVNVPRGKPTRLQTAFKTTELETRRRRLQHMEVELPFHFNKRGLRNCSAFSVSSESDLQCEVHRRRIGDAGLLFDSLALLPHDCEGELAKGQEGLLFQCSLNLLSLKERKESSRRGNSRAGPSRALFRQTKKSSFHSDASLDFFWAPYDEHALLLHPFSCVTATTLPDEGTARVSAVEECTQHFLAFVADSDGCLECREGPSALSSKDALPSSVAASATVGAQQTLQAKENQRERTLPAQTHTRPHQRSEKEAARCLLHQRLYCSRQGRKAASQTPARKEFRVEAKRKNLKEDAFLRCSLQGSGPSPSF